VPQSILLRADEVAMQNNWSADGGVIRVSSALLRV
jgi:hypothetical protein